MYVSYDEMIKNKRLCEWDIILPVLLDDVNVPLEDYGNIDSSTHCINLLQQRIDLQHVLAYCNTKKSAQSFCKMCNDRGIRANYFDADTKLSKRQEIINQFEASEFRILITVYTLSEGIDIPIADTCMFVEPRGSNINIQQCVGRVLRIHQDKPYAHVVLPIGNSSSIGVFLRKLSTFDKSIARSFAERDRCRIDVICMNKKDKIIANIEAAYAVFDRYGNEIGDTVWDKRMREVYDYFCKHKKLPSRSIKCGVSLDSLIQRSKTETPTYLKRWEDVQSAYKSLKDGDAMITAIQERIDWKPDDAEYMYSYEYFCKNDNLPPYIRKKDISEEEKMQKSAAKMIDAIVQGIKKRENASKIRFEKWKTGLLKLDKGQDMIAAIQKRIDSPSLKNIFKNNRKYVYDYFIKYENLPPYSKSNENQHRAASMIDNIIRNDKFGKRWEAWKEELSVLPAGNDLIKLIQKKIDSRQ
jgi:hypothetical protein